MESWLDRKVLEVLSLEKGARKGKRIVGGKAERWQAVYGTDIGASASTHL